MAAFTDFIDFTSALYLGLHHPSAALGQWQALTLGRPAALQTPPGERALAQALARLQGCEAALLLPSTLHLFWDLFGMLARMPISRPMPIAILIDDNAYPIARWGAERAQALGASLQLFPRGAVPMVLQLAQRASASGRRPVILADGYSPGASRLPPLAAYARIAFDCAGYLVLDDTQVLGLFGPDGGGSIPWRGLVGAHIIVGASLAKAFGAPLAVLSGSSALLRRFDACSQTRTHASPPSVAAIRAASHALRVNRDYGDVLRQRLWQRVAQWQHVMVQLGMRCSGGRFPVQTLHMNGGVDACALHAALARDGIATVLQKAGNNAGNNAAISFLLRADHSAADIDRAVAVLKHHLHHLEAA
jgi:8-amino-7-oxononanoate synthase